MQSSAPRTPAEKVSETALKLPISGKPATLGAKGKITKPFLKHPVFLFARVGHGTYTKESNQRKKASLN